MSYLYDQSHLPKKGTLSLKIVHKSLKLLQDSTPKFHLHGAKYTKVYNHPHISLDVKISSIKY